MAEPAGVLGDRHLVLLGLPGAGKSTIGPLVARALVRPFVDLDAAIEAEAGRSIPAIFAEEGEAAFRERERLLTDRLLAPDASPVVLAPGGGWIETPANRQHLGIDATAVYLRVPVPVAIARMGAAVRDRPLLAGPDPAVKLEELLARREHLYLQSQHTVSVESMSPAEAASYIVALATGERRD